MQLANAYDKWPKRNIPVDFLPKEEIPRDYTTKALKLLHTGVGTLPSLKKEEDEETEETAESGACLLDKSSGCYLQMHLYLHGHRV